MAYKDDMDLYAYVGEDPVNRGDPSGLASVSEFIRGFKDGIAAGTFFDIGLAQNGKSHSYQLGASIGTSIGWGLASRDFDKIAPGAPALAQADSAEARALTIASTMSARTQRSVTIAVTETAQGTRVVSSSEGALRPAARAALGPGEVAVQGARGAHAEVNGVAGARAAGLTPTGTAASRPICQECAAHLKEESIAPMSTLKN